MPVAGLFRTILHVITPGIYNCLPPHRAIGGSVYGCLPYWAIEGVAGPALGTITFICTLLLLDYGGRLGIGSFYGVALCFV